MRINPFKQQPRVDKPNRNAFDLSHAVNFTSQFGKLYPVLCKEVLPGDSFNINTAIGLRLMPMAFPVQSRMRADVHFFYVRNRNLWKNWQDFIGATKQVTPPFVQRTLDNASEIFGTGTLGDYLGVPTTYANSTSRLYKSPMFAALPATYNGQNLQDIPQQVGNDVNGWFKAQAYPVITQATAVKTFNQIRTTPLTGTGTLANVVQSFTTNYLSEKVAGTSQFELIAPSSTPLLPQKIYFFEVSTNNSAQMNGNVVSPSSTSLYLLTGWTNASPGFALSGATYRSANFQTMQIKKMFQGQAVVTAETFINDAINRGKQLLMVFETAAPAADSINPRDAKYNQIFNGVSITNIQNPVIDEISTNPQCPYIGAAPAIRINALPFRAYEAIYNSFYRNQQNDPFKINGTVEYNKFNTTLEDGADVTPYSLKSRNWEQDFLTTALPSPQQGLAPLVGARQVGNTNYVMQATIDGTEAQIQIKANDSGELTLIQNYSDNVPAGSIQALNEAINFGISINDFRNVNSLQRWLEKNMKHGFRYRDQIRSHFGVNVRFDELDMPEFLGGLSQDIQVNSISQTTETDNTPLGSYAGQGHAFGGSKHDVNHYFDEHGYIMAIFSVSPIPSYSQLLPKHLIKQNHLDYFTPEFGHIGLQPILTQEITPNEAAVQGAPLTKVFGYQRPFYDYLAATDSVHGQMRTTMRDFLINRYFEQVPELGAKFLVIDTEEVNDIFTVTDDSNDKIVGQIYFNITAKRPISRFAEPRID